MTDDAGAAAHDYANPFAEDNDAAALLDSFDTPKPKAPAADIERTAKAAEAVGEKGGFHSRAKKKKKVRRSASYETGRNTPISLKGYEADAKLINRLCDQQEWVKGQAFQYALAALAEKIEDPESEFWNERNFQGVD